MKQRLGIHPEYFWYDQELEDALAQGADAALYIGDAAYRQRNRAGLDKYDLGALWREWTGTPFVFALWQTSAGPESDRALRALAAQLTLSREWSLERLPELAERRADVYGWPCDELLSYWRSLEYGWDETLAAGLEQFYRRAVEIGEIAQAPSPVFLEL